MGAKNQDIIERRKRVMLPSTIGNDSPISLSVGKGIYVMDEEGRPYMDFTSQVGIASIGHGHPMVVKALQEHLSPRSDWNNLMSCIGSDFDHIRQVELAERLVQITPGNFAKKVWLDIGGAEGLIAAVEFLLHVRPERPQFLAFRGAFHGRKGYAKDLTCSKAIHKRGYHPSLNVHRMPYIDADYIEECVGRDFDPREVNGIVLEFVQGEGGIEVPFVQDVERLMEFSYKYGIKVVDDEIQAGLGRTGKMWACQHFGVEPDILVTSKSLGSGLPISATVICESIAGGREKELLPLGWHSLTFMGAPLCCTAALATLDAIEKEKLVENAESAGNHLGLRLKKISQTYNKNFRLMPKGLGLMRGLEFGWLDNRPNPAVKNKVIEMAFERGLLLIGAGHPDKNPTIRLMPPICVTKEQIDEAMNIIEGCLKVLN